MTRQQIAEVCNDGWGDPVLMAVVFWISFVIGHLLILAQCWDNDPPSRYMAQLTFRFLIAVDVLFLTYLWLC